MKGLKFIIKIARTMRIAKKANDRFDSVVRACAKISETNNELSFLVERIGPFNGPKIETIYRPDVVTIGEYDNCVIVKDGKIYEMKNWL